MIRLVIPLILCLILGYFASLQLSFRNSRHKVSYRFRIAAERDEEMNVEMNRCSMVVVTSPSPLNPDTTMIQGVIESAQRMFRMNGMANADVHVICDGYKIVDNKKTLTNPYAECKSGKVSTIAAESYDQFCSAIKCQKFSWKVSKMAEHLGFAHCVQYGLRAATTPFCLILQHDRIFIESALENVPVLTLLKAMDDNKGVRYIGFPTVKSCTHDKAQNVVYKIGKSLSTCQIDLQCSSKDHSSISLYPLMFWYDSNHFCHVQRYLEIFEPFKYAPQVLRDHLGMTGLRKMLLRPGDFIEDKFGQIQRDTLVALNKESTEKVCDAFKWFGSYLIWPSNNNLNNDSDNNIMVRHLRGRKRTFIENPSDFVQDLMLNLKSANTSSDIK